MAEAESETEISIEKGRVLRKFNHPNPNMVMNIAGGWWRIWSGLYYHSEAGYCLSRMTNGGTLVGVAVLHSKAGHNGKILALENLDHDIDWSGSVNSLRNEDDRPDRTLYDWMNDWMQNNPEGVSDSSSTLVRLHNSSLADIFSRGPDNEPQQAQQNGGYVCAVNNGGSNRSAHIWITPDRAELIQAYSGSTTVPDTPDLQSDEILHVVETLR